MATENFFGETLPGSTFEEGSQLSLGTRFHVNSTGVSSKGARWYVGASGPGGGGSITAKLYRNSDQSVLASGTIVSPVFAAWNEVLWSPVALSVGVGYTQAWETPNRYPATVNYPSWPVSTPSGKASTENPAGFFSGGAAYPATGVPHNYFADPILDTGSDTTPVSGSLDLRWKSYAQVAGALDLRWQVRTVVSGEIDLRWRQFVSVGGTLDLRWLARTAIGGDLDLRWRVLNQITGTLDLRWRAYARVMGSLSLVWITDGTTERRIAMATADLTEYINAHPQSIAIVADLREL